MAKVKRAAKKRRLICGIFDASTRVDEVMALLFRCVSEDFDIEEYLASLEKYQKCKLGEQIAQSVAATCAKYGIGMGSEQREVFTPGDIVGWQRDRASANTTAVSLLTALFVGSEDLHCISHTLTHVVLFP